MWEFAVRCTAMLNSNSELTAVKFVIVAGVFIWFCISIFIVFIVFILFQFFVFCYYFSNLKMFKWKLLVLLAWARHIALDWEEFVDCVCLLFVILTFYTFIDFVGFAIFLIKQINDTFLYAVVDVNCGPIQPNIHISNFFYFLIRLTSQSAQVELFRL